MAASFSSDMENTDRIVTLMNECRELGLPVERPDVNSSQYEFKPEGKKSIRFGLGGIKGVGAAAIEEIVLARESDGPFVDLFDFCARVDSRKANRKVIESLIRSGAMDDLGEHRNALMACVTLAMTTADQQASAKDAGQNDLFGLETSAPEQLETPQATAWDKASLLRHEKETLGVYLSGHPMDEHRAEILQLTGSTLSELNPQISRKAIVAGFVSAIRLRNTQKGKMAFLTLDDGTARLEVTVFTAVYGEFAERIKSDTLVIVEGTISIDERTGGISMRAEMVHDLKSAQGKWLRAVGIELMADAVDDKVLASLEQTLGRHQGGQCSVIVGYCNHDGTRVRLRLGENWRMNPQNGLVDELEALIGSDRVRVRYGSGEGDRSREEWRAPPPRESQPESEQAA